jgi:hypothetical protein
MGDVLLDALIGLQIFSISDYTPKVRNAVRLKRFGAAYFSLRAILTSDKPGPNLWLNFRTYHTVSEGEFEISLSYRVW